MKIAGIAAKACGARPVLLCITAALTCGCVGKPPTYYGAPVRIDDMGRVPPDPILPDDKVKTDVAAIALAGTACPHAGGRQSATLEGDQWFVDFGSSWTSVNKRDGAISDCIVLERQGF